MKFGAAAVGAITATLNIVATPAWAADDYPSWNDVQQAKDDVEAKQQLVDEIVEHVVELQDAVDRARIASAQAAELYLQAKVKADEAADRAESLQAQADKAAHKADLSKRRAGLLVAHLAKAGSGNLAMRLFASGDEGSDDLLYQLGTMSKLTQHSEDVYQRAIRDRAVAQSLAVQADSARTERERLQSIAEGALQNARAAEAATRKALNEQQTRSEEMVAQLAELKSTSKEVEREYLAGEKAKREREEARKAEEAAKKAAEQRAAAAQAKREEAAQAEAERKAAEQAEREKAERDKAEAEKSRDEQDSSGSHSDGRGDSSGSSGDSDSGSSTSTAGAGGSNGAGSPNASAVQTAINFAKAQLGEPYLLGAAGPNYWDCSGLTRMAYAAAGVGIGPHSATAQFYQAKARGQLVSYNNKQPGDLIFWGVPGNYYHVAIYLGGGLMIAAPQEGDVVKISGIWGVPWWQVARPTG